MSGPAGRYVIGVDLGTGGVKVALATTRGEILGHEAEKTDTLLLPGGGAEQDPDDWWRAIVTATRRLMARGLAPAADVAAICVSAQWGGLVPVDTKGQHLRNALIWMDSRGARYARALTGGGLRVPGVGYNAVGLLEWLRKTGGAPTRTGKDPVGQAQWLRHHEPGTWAATAYLLDVPEYLTMRLTGQAVAGWDTAVLRWCTDNRDVTAVRYDAPLARRCGFDLAKLPALVPPATIVSALRADVASELGLPASAAVTTGTGDTTAAAIGAGAVQDYRGHLYIGTSAWLSCHVPFKRTDVLRNVASLPAVVPGRYWIATIQDVAGKAVDWLIDNVVYAQDGMLDAHPAPPDALDRLNALAVSAPPGSNGVIFAPWLNGERTPVDDPDVRGGWFNVSLRTTRADLARAVFEGIALNTRWMKEAVERFARQELDGGFDELTFIGGGANSALWCQTLADILGTVIRQAEQPVLANARGAAMIAAISIGELTWDEAPALVPIAASYQPDRASRSRYDRQYRAFGELYRGYSRTRRRYGDQPATRLPGLTATAPPACGKSAVRHLAEHPGSGEVPFERPAELQAHNRGDLAELEGLAQAGKGLVFDAGTNQAGIGTVLRGDAQPEAGARPRSVQERVCGPDAGAAFQVVGHGARGRVRAQRRRSVQAVGFERQAAYRPGPGLGRHPPQGQHGDEEAGRGYDWPYPAVPGRVLDLPVRQQWRVRAPEHGRGGVQAAGQDGAGAEQEYQPDDHEPGAADPRGVPCHHRQPSLRRSRTLTRTGQSGSSVASLSSTTACTLSRRPAGSRSRVVARTLTV